MITVRGDGATDASIVQDLAGVYDFIGLAWLGTKPQPTRRDGNGCERSWSRATGVRPTHPQDFTRSSEQAILSVGELAGLPAGRFVVIPSGQAPVLGALIPWDRRPMADDVHHSIATFEPGGHGGRAPDIAPGVSW
jgi:hypothetical protein